MTVSEGPNKVLSYSAELDLTTVNNVTVSQNSGTYTFTDPGVVITTSAPGCAASGDTATCSVGSVVHVTVWLGDGDDSVTIDSSVKVTTALVGGSGDDTLNGGSAAQSNTIYGDDNVYLPAGDGDDVMTGGANGDFLDGGGGGDTMSSGGGGLDSVSYQPRTVGVVVDLSNAAGVHGEDTNGDGVADEGDTIGAGFEIVYGGAGNDRLTGNASPPYNSLSGGAGDDVLYGGSGVDPDFFVGGTGVDTVTYADRTQGVVVDLADSSAFQGQTGEIDNIDGVENVYGGAGNDELRGNAQNNLLRGGAGVDQLSGADGDDRLEARDSVAETELDCGAGSGDVVVADEEDTPTACETVLLPAYVLTVLRAGTGTGHVAAAGIDCGIDCSEKYNDGMVVVLQAHPDTGSGFGGWSGACTDASGYCVVTMNAAKSVTANFTMSAPEPLPSPSGSTPTPALSVRGGKLKEPDRGFRALRFTVVLSAPSSEPVTVAFATSNGTAKAKQDYVAKKGTLTFAPGETRKTIAVKVKGDARRERNETFRMTLSAAQNAVLGTARAKGTILNDD